MNFSIGFSPCPNDTFIFYALIHGRLGDAPFSFAPPVLDDVENLNLLALKSRLEVTKLSFNALAHVLDDYVLLRSGAALGRGCGPLIVARDPELFNNQKPLHIAIPGKYTTAAMLLSLFLTRPHHLVGMRFEKIMPAVAEGRVDAGVIIHESRFTYQQYGLHLVQDLGAWWEQSRHLPIPLGGIAAKRSLGKECLQQLEDWLSKSVQWAFANREACMPYIREHAQEMDDTVLQQHIELYVNDFSIRLGDEGEQAVCTFLNNARTLAGQQTISAADIFLS